MRVGDEFLEGGRELKWDVDGNKEEEKAKKLRHQIIANTETPQDRLLSQSKILFD